jgi:predicted nucleotidyltransferase
MRAVLDAFGDDARSFVFVGGCTLGLYARATGAPLRTTKDVDCISTVTPWVLQERRLADLCSRGILSPDPELQCRYRIRGSDVDVDVLSPDGLNVGGVNPWFERAVRRARPYEVGGSRTVTAMTPPYFLATKLVAFESRGPDAQSSKDAEDIVGLMVEVDDLVAQIDAERMRADVADLWARAMRKHGIAEVDLPDFVDWHLERREAEHRDRVVEALLALVRG